MPFTDVRLLILTLLGICGANGPLGPLSITTLLTVVPCGSIKLNGMPLKLIVPHFGKINRSCLFATRKHAVRRHRVGNLFQSEWNELFVFGQILKQIYKAFIVD